MEMRNLDEPRRAGSSGWAAFSTARTQSEFCAGWLAVLCDQIEGVRGGLLLLGPDQDSNFIPAAMWPNSESDLRYLVPTAERVVNERRGLVLSSDGTSVRRLDQPALTGHPIEVDGVLHGVVVLDIAPGADAELQRALRLLHWSTAWIVDRFRSNAIEQRDRHIARISSVIDFAATALQQEHLSTATLSIVNEMATRLQCDRVSIGFKANNRIEVARISNTATFDDRMSLVRRVGEAMDEVLDLDRALVYPLPNKDDIGLVAHAALAREFDDVAICSVPLLENGQTVGVITLERGNGVPFDDETLTLCSSVGALLGPILHLKQANERGIVLRLRDWGRQRVGAVFGPRHPGAKLVAICLLAAMLFLGFAQGTYRVTAKTVVEGSIQRAAVAPFDGHIAASFVRAGDIVTAGQPLCRLEDRDLQLELRQEESEREQALRRERQALAGGDRSALAVAAAQVLQSDALISLSKDKLARATLVAPFNGIVVSGDLDQLRGAPVEQGKLLFQIAPLDSYRVILQVDERDIANISIGQMGDLTLAGLPDQQLPFSVEQITPMATAQDGQNFFRVEAHLRASAARLRPGMEGVGKISIGQRRLVWIVTHNMMDWLQLWAWKIRP